MEKIQLTSWKGHISLNNIDVAQDPENAKEELVREIAKKVLREYLGAEPTESDMLKVNTAKPFTGDHIGFAYDKSILGVLCWHQEFNKFIVEFRADPRLEKL